MEQMITIAIPTYNRPKQLLETLKNLQRQTNQNFRIFICDNASDYDIYSEIKKHFSGKFYDKLTVHRRNVNVGGDNNIIGLFDFIKSDWLWIIGDDDVECEDSVDKIHKYISVYKDSAAIHFIEDGEYIENCSIESIEEYINKLYSKVNKNTAEIIWGEFANICNKVYNLNIMKGSLELAFQFSNCSMTSGIVLLNALMHNKKVTIVKDRLHYQNPGGWNVKRVALSSSVIRDIDFKISYDLKKKLLYIINIPYRMPLHYWLETEHHNTEELFLEQLYYGFYRYHLPLREKVDFWIRMKFFSNSIIYSLHLKINSIARRLKSRKRR